MVDYQDPASTPLNVCKQMIIIYDDDKYVELRNTRIKKKTTPTGENGQKQLVQNEN